MSAQVSHSLALREERFGVETTSGSVGDGTIGVTFQFRRKPDLLLQFLVGVAFQWPCVVMADLDLGVNDYGQLGTGSISPAYIAAPVKINLAS